MSNYYIAALFMISIIVFVGLLKRRNMWIWISLYWWILVLKNLYDYWGL